MWLGGERGNAGDLLSFKPNTPHHWPGIVNPSNSCQAALSNLQKDKGGVEQHIGLSHLTSLSIMFAAVYHSQWTQWSHTPDWMRLHKIVVGLPWHGWVVRQKGHSILAEESQSSKHGHLQHTRAHVTDCNKWAQGYLLAFEIKAFLRFTNSCYGFPLSHYRE